ncbi:ArsR family transcriptional regulator, partial [Campylobacter upsaliensis]|nr:ArsR family transcriptional regulator [Campylobacter upsaliensis]ELP6346941.1 ArsR family transcriptional regulator [Campylobacter upsaliensis]
MCENFKKALEKILGKKRFELLYFLCENADENGFVMIKISELEK